MISFQALDQVWRFLTSALLPNLSGRLLHVVTLQGSLWTWCWLFSPFALQLPSGWALCPQLLAVLQGRRVAVLSLPRAVLLWVFGLGFLWLVVLLSLGHLSHFLSLWISCGGVWTCPLCSWSPEFSGQPVPVFSCISCASWSLLCKMAVFPPVFPPPSPPSS